MPYNNQMSVLDQAISKVSGGDDAYKNKLKEHIREGMGYSNYINKMNVAAGRPLSLNLKGNITPSGVKSLVGGAMNMQQQEVGTYGQIAGAFDTAAGSLASEQVAREKAAKKKSDEENPFGLGQDWLDQQISDLTTVGIITTDEQGNTVSKQPTREEIMQEIYKKTVDEENMDYPEISKIKSEDIAKRISERLPKDFDTNRMYYKALSAGVSKDKAKEFAVIAEWDKLPEKKKEVIKTLYPEMASKAEVMGKDTTLLNEVTTKDENGDPPRYKELRKKYINIQDKQFKDATEDVYQKDLNSNINYALDEEVEVSGFNKSMFEIFKNAYENGQGDYKEELGVSNTKQFKNLVKSLYLDYEGFKTEGEIENEILRKINERLIK